MTKKNLRWKRHTVAVDEISRLEREIATIETAEQAKEAAKLTAHEDFWQTILDYADECDDVLAEKGFPAAGKMIAHDGTGNWWPISDADKTSPKPGENRRFKRGADFAKEHTLDFSDAWYAADIGLKCRLALQHLEKGAAGKPFHYAMMFEIASQRKDWQWRRGHKASILTGRKNRKVLSEHRIRPTQKRNPTPEQGAKQSRRC